MNTSRERFVEYARLIAEALETGYMEYDNEFGTQPRRQIRPRPAHSFRGRTYAAAVSPESMPLMAGLGIGVLVIPQKPWPTVQQDVAVYERVYREVNGGDPPRPISGGFVFCDESADRAEEMAHKWIGENYASVMRHYEFAAAPARGREGLRVLHGHHALRGTPRRRRAPSTTSSTSCRGARPTRSSPSSSTCGR